MKEIICSTLFIWFKKLLIWFKYSTGKNLRNNLFNFIIFKWRKCFLWFHKNISLSHITYVLCDCADIYFLNSKKKNINFISLIRIKKTFRTNINLFHFKKSHWENSFFDSKKHFFDIYGERKNFFRVKKVFLIKKKCLWSKEIDLFTLKKMFLSQQNFLQFKEIFSFTVYQRNVSLNRRNCFLLHVFSPF